MNKDIFITGCSQATRYYRMEYVRKYGLSERMRDIMLTALFEVLAQQNPT